MPKKRKLSITQEKREREIEEESTTKVSRGQKGEREREREEEEERSREKIFLTGKREAKATNELKRRTMDEEWMTPKQVSAKVVRRKYQYFVSGSQRNSAREK